MHFLYPQQQCKTLGGRLAELKDFETNDFVKHHLDLKYLLHEGKMKSCNIVFYLGAQIQTKFTIVMLHTSVS